MASNARSIVEGAQEIGGGEAVVATPVQELPVRVKRVVTTDEAKLQVVLEAEHLSAEGVDQVKRLLTLQQGLVRATFDLAQGELFGYDA